MVAVSAGVRSAMEQRSRPASDSLRPVSCSRTAYALLANVCSSSSMSLRAGLCRSVLRENCVKSSDRFIYVLFLKNVGRQEAQHRFAGAIDEDVLLHHHCEYRLCQFCRIKINSLHQTQTTDLCDSTMFLFEPIKPIAEVAADVVYVVEQVLF